MSDKSEQSTGNTAKNPGGADHPAEEGVEPKPSQAAKKAGDAVNPSAPGDTGTTPGTNAKIG